MTQETLAETLGISQESLCRMEKGLIVPRFERLFDFARPWTALLPTSLQSPNPNQTRLILPPLKHPHLRPLQSLHLSLPLPL